MHKTNHTKSISICNIFFCSFYVDVVCANLSFVCPLIGVAFFVSFGILSLFDFQADPSDYNGNRINAQQRDIHIPRAQQQQKTNGILILKPLFGSCTNALVLMCPLPIVWLIFVCFPSHFIYVMWFHLRVIVTWSLFSY